MAAHAVYFYDDDAFLIETVAQGEPKAAIRLGYSTSMRSSGNFRYFAALSVI